MAGVEITGGTGHSFVKLFGKHRSGGKKGASETVPLPPQRVYCRICGAYETFTRCWHRTASPKTCECCGILFEEVWELVRDFQPACPKCGEFVEQPTFEYGICDGCGSKFELVKGTQPNLLPNRYQREQMNKVGKVWRRV